MFTAWIRSNGKHFNQKEKNISKKTGIFSSALKN